MISLLDILIASEFVKKTEENVKSIGIAIGNTDSQLLTGGIFYGKL